MIKFEIKNQTGILTLNRPEKRNALHPEMIKQVKEKLEQIKDSDSIKSLIITGAGKAFCAGADLVYLNKLKDYSSIENEEDSRMLAEMYMNIYQFPKPTIAAVNGAAIAGGCGLATVCDIIIADSEHAKFGYSEVKIGFVPAIVSYFLLIRIGVALAKELLLSAKILNANEAYEIILVNQLSNNVLQKSLELTDSINKNSLTSVILTKKMILNITNLSLEEAVAYCLKLNTLSRSTEDFAVGLNNFLTKK